MKITLELEAVQWNGGTHDGIVPQPLELHYAGNRQLFYVTGGSQAPKGWLETTGTTIRPTAKPLPSDPDIVGFLRTVKKANVKPGEKETEQVSFYHRYYPFAKFPLLRKIESLTVKFDAASLELSLAKDFATCEQWKSLSESDNAIYPSGQRTISLLRGDWLIRLPNGAADKMTNDEFLAKTKPADPPKTSKPAKPTPDED